jgi:predicted phosphodiesterase
LEYHYLRQNISQRHALHCPDALSSESEPPMKIVVISDIHGNAFALDKVLADLQDEAYDYIVCLGDAIQGGPQPAETVALLRQIGCPIVMGNADAWLLTGVETGEPITGERKIKLDAIRDWSLSRLSETDRSFIAGFQSTVEIPLDDGRSLLCFHGSPNSFDEIILPTTPELGFHALLSPYLPHLMTGGHTHMQHVRRIGASDSFFFNPGSVGIAYTHQQADKDFRADPWAEYAMLSARNGRVTLEFRRVPYDVAALLDIYRASGRPYLEDAVSQYRK